MKINNLVEYFAVYGDNYLTVWSKINNHESALEQKGFFELEDFTETENDVEDFDFYDEEKRCDFIVGKTTYRIHSTDEDPEQNQQNNQTKFYF